MTCVSFYRSLYISPRIWSPVGNVLHSGLLYIRAEFCSRVPSDPLLEANFLKVHCNPREDFRRANYDSTTDKLIVPWSLCHICKMRIRNKLCLQGDIEVNRWIGTEPSTVWPPATPHHC